MIIPLKEETLTGTGAVSMRYYVVPSDKKPYLHFLVVRYAGKYPYGSAGNRDANYMHAMATAAVVYFEPWGVIHDLLELEYEWGDALREVLSVGPEIQPAGIALVLGPKSEEAVRTLCLGIDSAKTIEAIPGAFRDLESAWQYVEEQIE